MAMARIWENWIVDILICVIEAVWFYTASILVSEDERKHRDIIDWAIEHFPTPSCKVLKKLYGPLDVVYTDELDAAEMASASNCGKIKKCA